MAGIQASVKVYGLKAAIAKLLRVLAVANTGTQRITQTLAQQIEAEARAIVPVASGSLRDGIVAQKVGIYDWVVGASSQAGGAEKEYAEFVEYGTYKMAARPYMRPAVNAVEPSALGQLKGLAITIERI